ncbi:MAG: hypothetical protein Q4P05_05940 [Actinomycetaceae bacterium]|nr:hypothetical protein [Actinomycetaceae bacterium]
MIKKQFDATTPGITIALKKGSHGSFLREYQVMEYDFPDSATITANCEASNGASAESPDSGGDPAPGGSDGSQPGGGSSGGSTQSGTSSGHGLARTGVDGSQLGLLVSVAAGLLLAGAGSVAMSRKKN